MIYQEINLPIWAQLLIMAILILIGIELTKIKPVEAPKEVKEEKYPTTMLKSAMGLIFNHRDDITIKEADNDRQRVE